MFRANTREISHASECGEETFVVEKDLATGNVTAALRSWSRTGLWIATLVYPLVRTLQLRAGRAALDHLEDIARGAQTHHRRTLLLGSHWL